MTRAEEDIDDHGDDPTEMGDGGGTGAVSSGAAPLPLLLLTVEWKSPDGRAAFGSVEWHEWHRESAPPCAAAAGCQPCQGCLPAARDSSSSSFGRTITRPIRVWRRRGGGECPGAPLSVMVV